MFTAISRRAPVWAVSLLVLWAMNANAQPYFGADLSAMLAHARSQHPEVVAATLEADALAARATGADSLPDPMFQVEFKDLTRGRGIAPNDAGNRTYMVAQQFPLGGKRDLRRAVADSNTAEADARRRAMAEDLIMRVKIVQAQRYVTVAGLRLLHEQHTLLTRAIAASDRAYEQGRGGQDAPLLARLNLSRHEVEIARLEGDGRRYDARLSALLALDNSVPLVPPRSFAHIPPMDGIDASSLMVLARERNPDLLQQDRRISRGEQQIRLADAEWVPDITLGAGIVEEDLGLRGYEALLSVNIPLRWGLRDAKRGEAVTETSAARAKRKAIELDLTGRLREGLAMLASQKRIETLLTQQTLPQARATTEAALRAVEQGSALITEVLLAQSRLREIEIERLKVQAEQRITLAEMERAIGGEL